MTADRPGSCACPQALLRVDLRESLHVVERVAHLDVTAIAGELYAHWYIRPQPTDGPVANADYVMEINLLDALRAADVRSEQWEEGWKVQAVSNQGRILASRGSERRLLNRVDVLPLQRPCLPPRIGDAVRLVARRDMTAAEGGSWFTAGSQWDEANLRSGCVRLYWNVPLAHAATLLHHLSRRLTEAELAYAMKFPATPEGYARTDAAVVYLPDSDVDAATDALLGVHRELGAQLRSATPPLTLRLGPGLALAEDPGTGESFGENRCRLVAEAALKVVRDDVRDSNQQVRCLLGYLAQAGVDPAHPYLRSGSSRNYRALVIRDGG